MLGSLESIRVLYESCNSQPIKCLSNCLDTIAVVPDPMNGSRIISPFLLPALMQGSIKSGGYVAKCASLYGLLVTVPVSYTHLTLPTILLV